MREKRLARLEARSPTVSLKDLSDEELEAYYQKYKQLHPAVMQRVAEMSDDEFELFVAGLDEIEAWI
jgi:hypothetical protein